VCRLKQVTKPNLFRWTEENHENYEESSRLWAKFVLGLSRIRSRNANYYAATFLSISCSDGYIDTYLGFVVYFCLYS
jgi:hypothetical protein